MNLPLYPGVDLTEELLYQYGQTRMRKLFSLLLVTIAFVYRPEWMATHPKNCLGR